MENKVKHQHYIPQMYLRRFCDQNDQLYAYDIIKNRGVRNLPRAFSHEKFFYDIDANTMRELLKEYESLIDPARLDALSGEQLIEHMLSRIEGETNTVLNGLDSNQLALTNEHVRTVLIVFLKTLAIRTTAYRDQIQRIHSQTLPFLQGINLPLGTELTEYCSFTSEEYSTVLVVSPDRLYRGSIPNSPNWSFKIKVVNRQTMKQEQLQAGGNP